MNCLMPVHRQEEKIRPAITDALSYRQRATVQCHNAIHVLSRYPRKNKRTSLHDMRKFVRLMNVPLEFFTDVVDYLVEVGEITTNTDSEGEGKVTLNKVH